MENVKLLLVSVG